MWKRLRAVQDPHFVEPKPSYILRLQRADLLVAIGRDLEAGWLPPLVRQSRNAAVQPGARGYLDASRTVRILDIPPGQITRAMETCTRQRPHYYGWTRNGRRIAQAIAGEARRDRARRCSLLQPAICRFRPAPVGS